MAGDVLRWLGPRDPLAQTDLLTDAISDSQECKDPKTRRAGCHEQANQPCYCEEEQPSAGYYPGAIVYTAGQQRGQR